MFMGNHQTILVLGLGNPVLSDDGVGLAVAERLESLLEEHAIPGVTVRKSTRAGFELIDLMTGFDKAIIIDCMATDDPCPGRIHWLNVDEIAGSARLIGAHDIGLGVALDLAAELNIPMPDQIEIIGVEPFDMWSFGEELSPVINGAVDSIVNEVHDKLLRESEIVL